MALKNVKKVNAFVASLKASELKKVELIGKNKNELPKYFKKPPKDVFAGVSNLYIPSFEGDIGKLRPIPKEKFTWKSYGIRISHIADLESNVSDLHTGSDYRISCTIHNSGDLAVPCANVEFFESPPIDMVIGKLAVMGNRTSFDLNKLKLIGLKKCWINPGSTATVSINYSSLSEVSGIFFKLILVRVSSFSPKDLPRDINSLVITEEKRVAAKLFTLKKNS